MDRNGNKQVTKISIFITSIFIIFISLSYAFINQTLPGTKKQIVTGGNLEIELEEEKELTLENALPIYDKVGMMQDSFDFRIVNHGKQEASYVVKLVDITTGEKLDTALVKYGLTKEEQNRINYLSSIEDSVIDVGFIKENQTIHYSLRLWINSTVEDEDLIKDKSLKYRIEVELSNAEEVELSLDGGTSEETKSYIIHDQYTSLPIPAKEGYNFLGWYDEEDNLIVEGITPKNRNSKLIAKWAVVTYTLTFNPNGGVVNPTSKQIEHGGTYGSLPTPTKTGYKFIGWFTEKDGGIKITADTPIKLSDSQTLYAHWGLLIETIFSDSKLGDNCKTYDDGVDTFLVGQCSKNYVLYSGKLWRVVLKNNETGAVKIMTERTHVEMAYNASNNPSFANSYADKWLQQEFLPTLQDYQNYLVEDSDWYDTLNGSDTPSRPVGTTVKRTVGLLNSYEYYTTYGHSDGLATYSTGYLNTRAYWRLITPYDASNIRHIRPDGSLNYSNPSVSCALRPMLYLKQNLAIATSISEDGTYEHPYEIELGA